MKKSITKKLDGEIERCFKIHFNRVQIPIMDIGTIFNKAKTEYLKADGRTIDDILKTISLEYKGV